MVYDDRALPEQPWEVSVTVVALNNNQIWVMDKQIDTEDDKNMFGIRMHKMVPVVKDIATAAWKDVKKLLRELEIIFNSTLNPVVAGQNRVLSKFVKN